MVLRNRRMTSRFICFWRAIHAVVILANASRKIAAALLRVIALGASKRRARRLLFVASRIVLLESAWLFTQGDNSVNELLSTPRKQVRDATNVQRYWPLRAGSAFEKSNPSIMGGATAWIGPKYLA